jgi:hypothetical protein
VIRARGTLWESHMHHAASLKFGHGAAVFPRQTRGLCVEIISIKTLSAMAVQPDLIAHQVASSSSTSGG